MARYRPPQPASSAYITPQGAASLQEELDYLWQTKRPQVTQAVSEAAAQGDRSENAEYIYGKKQLREIDRRVRFLRKRLEKLVIVSEYPSDQNRVFFGAWIELEKEDGKRVNYRIVGPDEFDLKRGWISMDSPLAKALIGKAIDDEVLITLPEGEEYVYILGIQYEPSITAPEPKHPL
ncbi:transcription elongation factor GreB [Aestuariirhabdus sp. Z084]|uniref:transcription elongation factor GreB n=1 Tax=Aestuariirhabdus haliotis TaxID=2918751 RepID=UPI00201B3C54|nr:transcription elongation factor GreB [Aestuariirhabdus haliotis]MCL6414596.1 transcription elongation factor GreB [Aestuariirhabdus haliotis]MCL6418422.1 transcription elongation factor GreB [Aestuariirhabdus haliotis]